MPPLVLTAAAFIAGTVAAALLGGAWWATTIVAGLAGLAAWLSSARRPRLTAILVLLAVLAAAGAGHARFAAADERPDPPIARLTGTHEVVGTLHRDALVRGTIVRLDLDVERIDGARETGGLRLTMVAPGQPLRAGDRLRAIVEIERPASLTDFDYEQYLRDRDIHAVAAFPEQWTVVDVDGGGPFATLRRFRRWLVDNLERSLPEPESSLAAGMLLGERRTMPSGLADDLRDTGTTHLVVVSGQNVAMVLGLAIAFLAPLISRRRAALVTLAMLPGYLLLVGFDPPVVRAAIMAVGIAITSASGRRTPGWLYLLYAAALMLAFDPLLARDIAFQLSMSATAGVMLVAPPLRDRLLVLAGWSSEGAGAALVEAAALATGAALAVLPVQAAAFGSISLLTVPANVIVAPLYEGTLVVAAVASLLGWFDPVADALGTTMTFVPRTFVATVNLLARAPGTRLPIDAPLAAGAGWYLVLGGAAWWLRRGEAPVFSPGARSGFATSAALAAVAGGLWIAVLSPGQPNVTVTILDVGQGLAVLVEDGGSRVLIDAGPSDGAAIDALSRVGSTRAIDAVVITHGDNDHRGGLLEVERRITVARVFDDGTTAERLDIGDRIRLSSRTTIEVISPPVLTAGRAHRRDNNRSLVLLVTVGERRLLLTADIEKEAEQWLVTSGLDLRADAIVVPHHGSKSSSSQDFLDAVQPQVAVISAGESNRYGHPDPDVVARYRARGVLLLRTDEDGDVVLSSDGKRLWVKTSR